ncbi:4Fe-4S binding protein [Anaerolentibacter hominis]|uniref:pyridoxamine 5'-phosphate oxidase family protein n=1 Tax=Anaerolentibacter hominis TaxID=3079009 RepID=UPI0031B89B5F
MDKTKIESCFGLLRDVKSVAFATVDQEGHPRVRVIDVMFIEPEKLYFVTARGKDFYKELTETKEAAVTGMNEACCTVRLWGKVRREDQSLLERVFAENPVMNEVYPGDSRYILDVFSLYEGEGELFDLGKSPIEREPFSFGGHTLTVKGFQITGACTGCGTCLNVCPQKCIREGEPYRILQGHCLHCGLCAEVCPVKAVAAAG